MKKYLFWLVPIIFKVFPVSAQIHNSPTDSSWSVHFQMTAISQSHAGFKALYKGNNSLADSTEIGATSMTGTLFLGRRLWKGAAFYFNPEISGGRGLSFAVGVAGALNGETYRVGNPEPSIFIARAYFQQHFALSSSYEDAWDDVNQVKHKLPISRITLSAGKFAISDFYDNNSYSHDPRSQFLNWSLMSNGAWDYPANTRGYTMGVVAELIKPTWAIRLSSVAVPRIANAPKLEYAFGNAHSETIELEKKVHIAKRPGALRFIVSNTYSKAPSYQDGLRALSTGNTRLLDIISGDEEGAVYGGKKIGIGFNIEQELTNEIGFFSRLGWNDGKYATWAFTEIDQSISLGLSVKGSKWYRPGDVAGIAIVRNGLSADHRNFLKAGGYGFIIGDGKLNYGHEAILETYYNAKLANFFWLTVDYQFVKNPAYNKDRGPVHVFAVRGHIEF
jgi:high affinity Mn2+ porin